MRIDFSFDDGGQLDAKVAAFLDAYDFTGTFYLPGDMGIEYHDLYSALLDRGHEIGGHTVTHPSDIKKLSREELCYEILSNKSDLENTFNIQLTKFCYPRGRHDEQVRDLVKAAGYTEGRTTEVGYTSIFIKDPFQMPTTVHLYPRREYGHIPLLEYSKKKFDDALARGKDGYFHVWGHGWEMERLNVWEDFEQLMKYMQEKLSTDNWCKSPK